jgi:hypothetical protein
MVKGQVLIFELWEPNVTFINDFQNNFKFPFAFAFTSKLH